MNILKRIINNFTTRGFRNALRNLQEETQICGIHLYNLWHAKNYDHKTDLRLHFGCGPRIREGWVNIDLCAAKADLHLDLREPLPFRNNSVVVIESEHFFEHLSYPEPATAFLRECLRVMQPGGLFSVGVPDAEASLIAYAQRDEDLFRDAQQRFHPAWCTTPMHSLNYLFRQGDDHKYAWDFQSLSAVLTDTGFIDISRRTWDENRDSQKRRIRTLYIDAYKPNL